MKALLITVALVLSSAGIASASEKDCKKNGNGYDCQVGNTILTVANASNAAEAAAFAAQHQSQNQGQTQGQGQGQSQSSDNDNSNQSANVNQNRYSSEYKDESVSLSAAAGGMCDTGFNLGVVGVGGTGVCWSNKAGKLAKLAAVANEAGLDRCLIAQIIVSAPETKHIKVTCK